MVAVPLASEPEPVALSAALAALSVAEEMAEEADALGKC